MLRKTADEASRVTLSPGEPRLAHGYATALRAPDASRLSVNHDSGIKVTLPTVEIEASSRLVGRLQRCALNDTWTNINLCDEH